MEREIEIKGLFKPKFRGVPTKVTRPAEEELLQQSKWVVEEMGPDRDLKLSVTNRGYGRCIVFYLKKGDC